MVQFFHPIPGARLVPSRANVLVDAATGREVLHVGCVDAGMTEARIESDALLHAKLAKVARRLVGVDVDGAGLERLRALGFADLHQASSADWFPVKERFDVVLLAEVLEHVGDPGGFVAQYAQRIHPEGRLVITVPNAFCLITFLRLFRGIETTHEDHVAYYSYVTLRQLLSRVGLTIESIKFYSELDRLSGAKRAMKRVFNGLLSLWPQMGEGIIVVARRVR